MSFTIRSPYALRVWVATALLSVVIGTSATTIRAQTSSTANLIVDKSAITTSTELGQVDFNIVVMNDGPETAYGVLLSDVPPPGGQHAGDVQIEYSSGTSTTSPGSDRYALVLNDLDPGSSVSVTIPYFYAVSGNFVNTAVVRSNGFDTEPTNNFSSAPFTIVNFGDVRFANLQITKEGTTDTLVAGDAITYTIVITNNGETSATNVVVQDPIPSGTEFVQATATTGTVTYNPAGFIVAELGTLEAGTSESIDLMVRSFESRDFGQVVNVASYTMDQTSTNIIEDNSAVVITNVNPSPDSECLTYDVVFEGPATTKCKTNRFGVLRCKVKAKLFITNTSNETSPKTKILYYISDDPVYDTSDIGFKVQPLKRLKPGQTAKRKLRARPPAGVETRGKYLIARVQCQDEGHSSDSTPIVEKVD